MPHSSYCPICFSSFRSHPSISLPCECTCCHSCLADWMALKIKEPSFSSKKTIPCFSQKCSQRFQIQSVYYRLPKPIRQQIDEELLNSYLNKTSDIRRCPNMRCSYAGIIDTSMKCSEPLRCQACQTTWRDPLHFSSTEKLLDLASKTKTKRNEAFSSLWKGLWTKNCPGCQAPIEKAGGCPHMKCSSCDVSFCWTCSGYHDNSIHALKSFLYCIPFIALLIIALYAIYQLSLVSTAVNLFMNNIVRPFMTWFWYIVWYVFLCLFSSILVNTAFVLGYFLQHTFTDGPQKTQFHPIEFLGMILAICSFLYYFSYPKLILVVGLAEIPVILIAMLIRRRSINAGRKAHKRDWNDRDAKRQVYKSDWKSEPRNKNYWKEANRLVKSKKNNAFKFPAHRH